MASGGHVKVTSAGEVAFMSDASVSKLTESYAQALKDIEKQTNATYNKMSDAVRNKLSDMQKSGFDFASATDAQIKAQLNSLTDYNEALAQEYIDNLRKQSVATNDLRVQQKKDEENHLKAGIIAWENYIRTKSSVEQQAMVKDAKNAAISEKEKQESLIDILKIQSKQTLDEIADRQSKISALEAEAMARELSETEKHDLEKLKIERTYLNDKYTEEVNSLTEAEENVDKLNEKITKLKSMQGIKAQAQDAIDAVNQLKEERKSLLDERAGLDKSLRERTDALTQQYMQQGMTKQQAKTAAQNDPQIKALNERLTEIGKRLEGDGANSKSLNQEIKEANKKARKEAAEANKASLKQAVSLKSLGDATKEGLKKVANAVLDASKEIDSKISTFYQYQAKMEARLQGSNKSWGESLKTISRNLALSPFIKQTDVVTKMQSLIESGIAYDVELRAFLGVISEDIASTFEVMQKSLTRMIRIQQSDSTAMRLGMEAYLTRFYNGLFSDTSYLTDQFDSVTDAIFEASSRLEKAQSIEFEYAVQKWLGALYSLGLSDQAVNQIASGLNYLGTGDVESLNGNSQLTTLFGMAASRAEGISYSDLITNGLDASNTNTLMEAMVRYLREIAEQTKDNNVVAKSYSNMLGVSMSDLTVLSKIDNKTLSSISNNMMSYGDTLAELNYQTSEISKRVHLSTVINTLGDNALTTAATGIGSSFLYPMWWATKLFKDITGGIALPFVNVMGFGLDLETTVADLILTGIAGLSLLGSLVSTIGSGGVFGNYDLGLWGYQEENIRGSGAPKIGGSGVSSGVSQSSTMTSSGSGEDIENSTLGQGAESAGEKGKTINAAGGAESDYSFKDFRKDLFEDQLPISLDEQMYEVASDIYDLLNEKAINTKIVGSTVEILTKSRITNTPLAVSIDGMDAGAMSGSILSSSSGSSLSSTVDSLAIGVDSIGGSLSDISELFPLLSQINDILNTINSSVLSIKTSTSSTSNVNSSNSSFQSFASSQNATTSNQSYSSSGSRIKSLSSNASSSSVSSEAYYDSTSSTSASINANSTTEASMNSIQTFEGIIEKYNLDGNGALNVNVKSLPEVTLGTVDKGAREFFTEYAQKFLKTIIIEAIQNGLINTEDIENGAPLDIAKLLNNIKDSSDAQYRELSDIDNKMQQIIFRSNM